MVVKGKRKDTPGERKLEAQRKRRDTALLLLTAAFLLGAVAGCLLEGKLSAAPYIDAFWDQAAQAAILPPLWRELWVIFRWPLAAVALAALPLRWVSMPILFFLRGLFLSYGVAALMGGMSGAEVLCTGVVFGPTCLLTVPILFVLASVGLLRKDMPGRGLRPALCTLPFLALCVFLDQAVVPKLLTVLLKGFTAASGGV